MKRRLGNIIWKRLSYVNFAISAIALAMGLDKMLLYDNGENYPFKVHNAYVGGDAYNYIINGNYATGFFVLATMFALIGIGFVILYYLSKLVDENRTQTATAFSVEHAEGTPSTYSQGAPIRKFRFRPSISEWVTANQTKVVFACVAITCIIVLSVIIKHGL